MQALLLILAMGSCLGDTGSLQNLAIGMGIGIIIGLILASFSTFSRFGRDLLTVSPLCLVLYRVLRSCR